MDKYIKVSFSDALMAPIYFSKLSAAIEFCRLHATHCKWINFDGTLLTTPSTWFL